MPFEFGDIVLVPFPFTSQTASKERPVVVVSSRAYNAAKPDVVLMAVTRDNAILGEVWVQNWKAADPSSPPSNRPSSFVGSARLSPPIAKRSARQSRKRSGDLVSHPDFEP